MKNPLILMGAITGNPSKTQIDEMMRCYSQQGIQQFLIYPRSGCEIEYMSERWIQVCSYIIEAAAELGIDIWLYDEFNWPSGTCSGKVMVENPELYAQSVLVKDGNYSIKINKDYADILNPEAVDCFIKNTHEVYYKHFEKYFGTVIKGMFTDEPDFSAAMRWDEGSYPYTKNLDLIYKETFDADLFEEMTRTPASPDFKKRLLDLLGDMFRTNYIGKLDSWCREHNIVLTGHTMDEHSINLGVKTCGNTIRALRGFSLPGIDEIHTRTTIDTAEWLTFGCVEAAARTTKNGALAELFALGPTDIVPGKIEQMIWLCAMFGVDHYLLAVAAVDARGNYIKNAWYNPMNYTSPWFKGYGDLGKSAMKAALFAKKEIAPEVFVRYPSEAAAEEFGMGDTINEKLYNVLRSLTRNQYQWQLFDNVEEVPQGACIIDFAGDEPAEDIIKRVKEKKQPQIYVLEGDLLADDLLVRRFTDGSCIVLDLRDSDEERLLTVCSNGTKNSIRLPGRGHYVLSEQLPLMSKTICEFAPDFRLSLSKENTLRCNLNKGSQNFTFTVSEELKNIRFAVRNYYFDGEITLDSKKLIADKECKVLAKGIDELYKCTEPFTLAVGEHTVCTNISAESEYYLPTCFVCGEFASDEKYCLRFLPKSVGAEKLDKTTLPQFAGVISYEAEVEVPVEPCAITFDSAELYTRLYINGYEMGGRLSDYRWEIPSEYLGSTAKIKIEQYTTIAPMFGLVHEAVTAEENNFGWAQGYTDARYRKCGITKMRFIKNEQ